MDDKWAFLGLVVRARAYVYGDRLMADIRRKKVKVVLLSASASPRTTKQVLDKCRTYQVEVMDQIDSHIIEYYFNRPVVAVGITDHHMADRIIKEMR